MLSGKVFVEGHEQQAVPHVSANYIVREALRDVPRANTTRSPCRPPGCHPDLVPLSRHRSTPPWTRRGPVLLSDCRSLDSTAAFTQQSQILSNQYPSCRVLSAPDWVANDLPLNYQFGPWLSASCASEPTVAECLFCGMELRGTMQHRISDQQQS